MIVYIDDALVYTSGNFAQHLQHLRSFYARMRHAGLHIKPAKCALSRHSVDLLGHTTDGTTTVRDAAEADATAAAAESPVWR